VLALAGADGAGEDVLVTGLPVAHPAVNPRAAMTTNVPATVLKFLRSLLTRIPCLEPRTRINLIEPMPGLRWRAEAKGLRTG
jgi:hypothetical protein